MLPEIAIALLLAAEASAPAARSGGQVTVQKGANPAQKVTPSGQPSPAKSAEKEMLDVELLQLLDILEQWDLFMNYTFFEGEKP